MHAAFVREITRQHCFRSKTVPWILKIYGYPFHRWASPRRQALFGAPNFLIFFLYHRFWLLLHTELSLLNSGTEKIINFNPKNSQFHSVYFDLFRNGYEPQTTALINLITPSNGVFYDIGSNWGWFSLSLATQPRVSMVKSMHWSRFLGVMLICAVSSNRQVWKQKLNATRWLFRIAMAMGTMHMADSFSSGLATLDADKVEGRQTIEIATLDSLLCEPPDVIKIDVEGVEERFSLGKNLIEKHKPMITFENVRAFTDVEGALNPIFFLSERGYVFYRFAWSRTLGNKTYYIGDDIEENVPDKELLTLRGIRAIRTFYACGWRQYICVPQ